MKVNILYNDRPLCLNYNKKQHSIRAYIFIFQILRKKSENGFLNYVREKRFLFLKIKSMI